LRSVRTTRKWRRVHLAVGALILAVPASAFALSATGQPTTIHLATAPRHVRFGHELTLTGVVSGASAGQPVELQFAPAGGSSWRTIAYGIVRTGGGFRVRARVPHTGLLRVATPTTTSGAQVASAVPASGGASAASAADPGASAPQRVTVAAAIQLRPRSRNALAGQPLDVRGKLLPGVGGRRVVLQGLSAGHWRPLASDRTGSGGRFEIRYVPGGTGQQRLRVKFAGDRLNSRVTAPAGRLTVFRQTVASWYDDGGETACGFHAQYGVASPSLPCGTHVTFLYGGRTVTATVDDRGPFVGGRDWDLNQSTAGALGFDGVDTVWSSR
jgi:rare lipoprotein A